MFSSAEGVSSNVGAVNPASLQVERLVCRYGRYVAVNSVTLDLTRGEHVAVTGENGSGKSTLVRAIVGLHREMSGKVAVDGQIIDGKSRMGQRRRITWMPQRQSIGRFPFLVRELLESSGNPDASFGAAERLGILKLTERPLTALSGGQLQRAFLARALGAIVGGAGLLLADEPTAALDFEGQELFGEILAQLPVTVLVVTHDAAVADGCHRVMQMANGSIREAAT